jgi:hypothetical protein
VGFDSKRGRIIANGLRYGLGVAMDAANAGGVRLHHIEDLADHAAM